MSPSPSTPQDPTATNMAECTEFVANSMLTDGHLFGHQSEHASFKVDTPTTAIRISHGRLHQLAMRDPTDKFDLPDHTAWQMNVALERNDVSRNTRGVLGETFVPTLDLYGNRIVEGMDSIRGSEEDCELIVDSAIKRFLDGVGILSFE